MAAQDGKLPTASLELQWDQYWRQWDQDASNIKTGWSEAVLKAYGSYRRAVETARTRASRKLRDLDTKNEPTELEINRNIETNKVRQFFQDIEVARIEANNPHIHINRTNLRQDLADVKKRFAKPSLQTREDSAHKEALQAMSEGEIEDAEDQIVNDFTNAHTEAWFTLVTADEKNADLGETKEKWPRYPPALLAELNDCAQLDAVNAYRAQNN